MKFSLGEVKKNGEVLAQWSSHYLEEYRVANINKSTPIQNLMECWVPPIAPFFKVNVYGVVFAAQQEEGQVVKHHENGQVVATSSQKIKATLRSRLRPLKSTCSSLGDGSLSLKVTL